MKRKRGLVHVILALLMSMLLIVSTGCGKSGSGDSSSDKKTDKTETLADVNTIPEDGVITKEQFKTVAGENKKVQFKGTTDDGITYIWTYDCSKIQNPADQNLKIDFSEKGLDDLKKQANNANDALKMTMYGKGLICVPLRKKIQQHRQILLIKRQRQLLQQRKIQSHRKEPLL